MSEHTHPIPPPPDDAFLAEIITAPVSQLFVDHRYQRGVKKSSVKNLVENWNWNRYIPVIVTHRGGSGQPDRFAIIDGQQRFMAAQELGIANLPAILIVGRTLEDEAERFVGANTGAPVGTGDRFKAEYLRKEPRYVAIAEAVRAEGYDLQCIRDSGPKEVPAPFVIAATYAVETLDKQGVLRRVLRLIARAWGEDPHKDMVTSPFLMGLSLAMRHMDRFEVGDDAMVAGFRQRGVTELLNMGHERFKSMVTSRSVPGGIAAVLIETFNYRKRADQVVPPYDRSAARAMIASASARSQIARGTLHDVSQYAGRTERGPRGRYRRATT